MCIRKDESKIRLELTLYTFSVATLLLLTSCSTILSFYNVLSSLPEQVLLLTDVVG